MYEDTIQTYGSVSVSSWDGVNCEMRSQLKVAALSEISIAGLSHCDWVTIRAVSFSTSRRLRACSWLVEISADRDGVELRVTAAYKDRTGPWTGAVHLCRCISPWRKYFDRTSNACSLQGCIKVSGGPGDVPKCGLLPQWAHIFAFTMSTGTCLSEVNRVTVRYRKGPLSQRSAITKVAIAM